MMMQSFISYLGTKLHSLNPSLLSQPPNTNEVTENDICYYGPNGERTGGSVIFCQDLPDGKIGVVGSWFLSPERHAVEMIVFFIFFSSCIGMTYPELVKRTGLAVPQPLFIRLITALCTIGTLGYKLAGYRGKVLFFVMPCNVMWSLASVLCFYPNLSAQTSHVLCQGLYAGIGLCFLAIATPDVIDLKLPGEIPFFFFTHYVQFILPIYHAFSGHLTILPVVHNEKKYGYWEYFINWTVFTAGVFGLFYFCFVSMLSIVSGINLNYMLSPPPTPGDFLDDRQDFRVISCLCIFLLFSFTRALGMFIGQLTQKNKEKSS